MQPVRGCQSVYAQNGEKLFSGGWDPRAIFHVLTGNDPSFWKGKRVLEIAGNTGGLSLEIARCGANVILTEPDPFENCITLTLPIIESAAKEEHLELSFIRLDFYDALRLGKFDVIICLGLIYHFKYPQYMIDCISAARPNFLFVSTQTHPSDDLGMYNRQTPGILPSRMLDPNGEISGYHPTRALFEAMLRAGGFGNIESLTARVDFPNVAPGLTNSSYYRAELLTPKDPEIEKRAYYPR